jgi:hypothetical protein
MKLANRWRLVWLALFLSGCIQTTARPESTLPAQIRGTPSAQEFPVKPIPLSGPAASRKAELSGMAWYGDTLILLPQYPARFGDGPDGALFAIPKTDLLAYLDGSWTEPLLPQEVPLVAPGLANKLPGYQGFEAIAFQGDQVYLTIETKPRADMLGYLVSGSISPDLSQVSLDVDNLQAIQPQAHLDNMADETLLLAGDRLVTIYEANGVNVNPSPLAHLFTLHLQQVSTIPFPNIEYRITDATALDSAGQFWAINYFYPGDTLLKPGPDLLAERYGEGPTHARYKTVERLVEFHYSPSGIQLVDRPPIQLQLIDDNHSRNWEGLARLGQRGFLLATDTFPETILGFVSSPP